MPRLDADRFNAPGAIRSLRAFRKSARQFLNPTITDIPMSPELARIVDSYRRKNGLTAKTE